MPTPRGKTLSMATHAALQPKLTRGPFIEVRKDHDELESKFVVATDATHAAIRPDIDPLFLTPAVSL